MKTKILNQEPERTIALIFDENEEVASGLLHFAEEQNLTAARLSAIGALSRVVLGFFDLQARDYRRIEINEQVEVISLLGNIALKGAEKKFMLTSLSENPMARPTAVTCLQAGCALPWR